MVIIHHERCWETHPTAAGQLHPSALYYSYLPITLFFVIANNATTKKEYVLNQSSSSSFRFEVRRSSSNSVVSNGDGRT